MVLTKDRLLALGVTILNGVLGAWLGRFSESSAKEAGLALLLSLPGLAIIWFRESLRDNELAFPRGIRGESPPTLLAMVGWFFLLVIPLFYVYWLSNHLREAPEAKEPVRNPVRHFPADFRDSSAALRQLIDTFSVDGFGGRCSDWAAHPPTHQSQRQVRNLHWNYGFPQGYSRADGWGHW